MTKNTRLRLLVPAHIRTLLGLTSALLLTACGTALFSEIDPIQGTACTEIGCSNQVAIQLATPMSLPYDIEVEANGVTWTGTCTATGIETDEEKGDTVLYCTADDLTLSITPEELRVSVTSGEETRELTATPEYVTTQPNGPQCEPTCRQAQVEGL